MVKKFCPKCRSFSYSAKTQGRWICPSCGYDLTLKPILMLEQSDRTDVSQIKTSQAKK